MALDETNVQYKPGESLSAGGIEQRNHEMAAQRVSTELNAHMRFIDPATPWDLKVELTSCCAIVKL